MHNPNIDENEVLRNALSGLNKDVPPMPEGLHAAWMQKVEDDMEEKRIEKTRNRKAFTRFLSIAAVMVFVIGGTLLTRDDMDHWTKVASQRWSLEAGYQSMVEANGALTVDARSADEYSQKLAAYEAYDAGISDTYSTTSLRSARGVEMDAAAEPVTEELATETSTAAEKKIIRTASLTIKTQTYDMSLTNLKALCEADGGWIESSSESMNSSTSLRRAYLTLRIPQDALDGYLTGAEQLGRITNRSETATDVTASYQDTRTRLDTQLALMDRLQALITESADLNDLLALENQIADTQYMIDSLQSSLNATDRQVTYSTVSITLQEENTPELTDTTISLGDRLSAAIRMGSESFVDFAQDMLVFTVAVLPFAAIVAAFVAAVVLIRKFKRRNK